MDFLFTSEGLISLLTLTFLEIVLGIDNVIFISIIASKLPLHQQNKARIVGLTLALLVRIAMLFMVSWLMGLSKPLFTIGDLAISYRDLILFAGGLFLIGKSVSEIHHKLEGLEESEEPDAARVYPTFASTIVQIIMLDIVFSLDSILTAVGLVDHLTVIIIAVIVSIVVMIIFAKTISDFVERNLPMKILAMSFLVLIGTLLVAEGLHFHVPRGYIYFAMAFAIGVELINMKFRKRKNGIEKPSSTKKQNIRRVDPSLDLD
jgi:predicted tellurium resistance membrane protein TerC